MSNSIKICMVLLMFASLAAFRCTPDKIVPPPINLTSQYMGTYTRQVVDTDSSVVVPILWSFSADNFSLDYDWEHYPIKDSAKIPDDFLLCGWKGEYKIDGGIELVLPPPDSKDSARTVRTCDGPYAPYGQYEFNQTVSGVITMTSLTENPQGKSVVRTIHLTRKA
jgi:hypothetical protein